MAIVVNFDVIVRAFWGNQANKWMVGIIIVTLVSVSQTLTVICSSHTYELCSVRQVYKNSLSIIQSQGG